MRAPLSWLRDFADFPDDVALLRSTLDDLGLVVEDVEIVGEGLGDVIVARIDEVTAIEGADKVRRVVVDAGEGPLEIVCGATNFELGDLVPLAPVGAVLPGGFEIARRKMRGVTSNGMLCSGKELGLGEDHSGRLLLTETPGAVPGKGIVEALGLEPDVVFDVTVEGNRPDAWCIAGIARDLAARLELDFSEVAPDAPASSGIATSSIVSAEVVDSGLCSRLGVAVLSGVEVRPSPEWIARRLTLAGMRPINNVVDASNYVMLEFGQPTHPYDLARVPGSGLRVRQAAVGESLTTLDGIERTLGIPGKGLGDTGIDCVICDAEDTVVGIAGIMGGATSEIGDSTTDVLLEAAAFDPIAITRTSRRLALRTEAAARFSKGSDPGIIERAIERFAQLVALTSPNLRIAADPIVIPAEPPAPLEVSVPIERVNALLGTSMTASHAAATLERMGFGVEEDGGVIRVQVPTNRPDIRAGDPGVADVTEEIARAVGYSSLPRRAPSWPQPGAPGVRQLLRGELRSLMVGVGASEAWTSSLVAAGEMDLLGIAEPEVVVTNPLTAEESRLRRSLLPGLLRAVGRNLERRQEDVALFEIGAVFIHPDVEGSGRQSRAGAAGSSEISVPAESERLHVLLARGGDDARTTVALAQAVADGLSLKRIVVVDSDPGATLTAGLHPTRSALLADKASGAIVGTVGEVDPRLVDEIAPGARDRRIASLELYVDVLRDVELVARRPLEAAGVSRFPSSDLDLAFVVPDVIGVEELLDAVASGSSGLLESIRLFDVYRGAGVPEGSRSLAVRCRLVADDRTLSDADLSQVRQSMIDAATSIVGAVLR